MPKSTYQGVRSHVSGSYRAESLHGKDYIVVPVVALVEGVLQGMSSSGPELALASEFGKFPDSWNGRPVVMSHPINDEGMPVSANSPAVLEAYQIGFLFNSKLTDNRLEQEAWIDKTLVAAASDDAKDVLEALEKGEIIEVSTGYFATIEPSSGMYANKKYDAVQREITPDHLAFLPLGTFGACSNADGCGAKLAANSSPDMKFTPYKDFRIDNVTAPCCAKCAETGGSCQHEHKDPDMPTTNADANASMDSKDPKKGKKKKDPTAYEATTIANTIADGVTLQDARSAVGCALKDAGYGMYCYVVAMTTSDVIFEMYDNFAGDYRMYSLSYSVDSEGAVTFNGNPQAVTLMTKVVPVNNQTAGADATGEGEADMPNDTKTPVGTPPTPQANTQKDPIKLQNDAGSLEITFNEKGEPNGFAFTPKVNAAPKPATTEEFIAQAPSEMQEVLRSSLKLHSDQKTATIKALKDSGRCKFSDERLQAMSLTDLQDLADLANVPTYEGRALPVAQHRDEDPGYTEAPLVFEAPSPKAAA